MRRPIVMAIALCVVLFCAPAMATQTETDALAVYQQLTADNQSPAKIFSKFILALASRPGTTGTETLSQMVAPAERAGKLMVTGLRKELSNRQVKLFSERLELATETFLASYMALQGQVDAVSGRTVASDQFYASAIFEAESFGISGEDFDLLIFKGINRFEKRLARSGVSQVDQDLADVLLQNALHCLGVKVSMDNFAAALELLNPEPVEGWDEKWVNLEEVAESHIAAYIENLEGFLIDEVGTFSTATLMLQKFNQEAMADLLSLQLAMNLSFISTDTNVDDLIVKMNEAGGSMATLSTEEFAQSGVIYQGLNYMAIYGWIDPEMDIRYSPVSALQDQIAALGGQVPTQPDTELFDSPYLPVFNMVYDMDLNNKIYALEKSLLQDDIFERESRPLNRQEYYKLYRAYQKRQRTIIRHLKGVGLQEKEAIGYLLTPLVLL